jgi:hypothetical protein
LFATFSTDLFVTAVGKITRTDTALKLNPRRLSGVVLMFSMKGTVRYSTYNLFLEKPIESLNTKGCGVVAVTEAGIVTEIVHLQSKAVFQVHHMPDHGSVSA